MFDRLKVIFLIVCILKSSQVLAQNEFLSCRYHVDDDFGYTCELSIRNANGVNNITEIDGYHLVDHSDEDVLRVFAQANRSISANIPNIICDTFNNVKSIYLTQISIQSIPDDSFSRCTKVTSIQVMNNRINDIHQLAFGNNKELRTLHLHTNNLTTLADFIFDNQTNLEQLWLYSNRISSLPTNAFRNLRNLKELNLASNLLTALHPEWFRGMAQLQTLYLYSNQIAELPRHAFVSLRNMNLLSIYSNRIRAIHSDSFGVLQKLKTVVIYSNLVDAVDEMFIDNTDVSSLDIRSNNCANVSITDVTTARNTMRSNLAKCISNFNNLSNLCRHHSMWSPDDSENVCFDDDWNTSLCQLQNENLMFQKDVLYEVRNGNEEMMAAVEDVKNTVNVQAENMEEILENLRNEILELKTRPCSCNV